jgi:hypothetical protein
MRNPQIGYSHTLCLLGSALRRTAATLLMSSGQRAGNAGTMRYATPCPATKQHSAPDRTQTSQPLFRHTCTSVLIPLLSH